MTRQQILDRDDPPQLRVILNEAAVRRAVGGADVMRAQVTALTAERERSNVTVQVLPFTAGEHPAMACGPFVLLDFPQAADPGVVHAENLTARSCSTTRRISGSTPGRSISCRPLPSDRENPGIC